MSTTPFQIEQFRNCMLVALRGKWTMSTNIQYLAKLSESLKARQGRPFHLFVDMRGWQIPKSDNFNQIKSSITLDRRNQLSELWLENDETDAEHIARRFFNSPSTKLGFTLFRTKNVSDFITHCEDKADDVVMEYVRSWIAL
ncbi:arginine decarboxylase [Alteromonas sp. IB21]|uniref:arginine decarboxylase n=1 Tax=Alteromonas sp. IB21 TaxID=2779369 RepID=UPI0018E73E6B|nr:arginine decarboxylase [Alteromonas sp. IB21]MBJ2129154.1 arginine decarboxylase [Alteromonas sp. IB21]